MTPATAHWRRIVAAAAAARPWLCAGCVVVGAGVVATGGFGLRAALGLGFGFSASAASLASCAAGSGCAASGRRLIALDQIRRHTLAYARHAFGKHRPAIAGKLFLLVEMKDVELVDVEIRAGRPAPAPPSTSAAIVRTRRGSAHRTSLNSCHWPRSAPTVHRRANGCPPASRHRWRPCRYSGARRSASPLRQAESASNSRAVWRNALPGSASGSSRRRISVSGALSTSSSPARTAARSLQRCVERTVGGELIISGGSPPWRSRCEISAAARSCASAR